ncbi:MAG: biotin synthase BioB [Bdellovibrionales bacterium]
MNLSDIKSLYFKPLMAIIETAHSIHKTHFDTQKIQASRLLSIKTGACPEDCCYCSQSARYKTEVKKETLLTLKTVLEKAKEAQKEGATRFCMGAAWREVKDGSSFDKVLEMVRAVNDLGLEVCCTLGMLTLKQAQKLKQAGLYAYNHNIDTSPEFYSKIITTRKYEDRLQTLKNVRQAGLTVCTGGILGLGESKEDRISFLNQLHLISPPPESITINLLVPMKGTPLENQKPISTLEVVRVIAVARILMKKSMIRLSAGRARMNETEQLLCFYSGANSIFLGDKLLTAENPSLSSDEQLLNTIGLQLSKSSENLHV